MVIKCPVYGLEDLVKQLLLLIPVSYCVILCMFLIKQNRP